MAELISIFDIGTVIIILLVGIPAIVNFITWCKRLWDKREKFKQDSIEQGKRQEAQREQKETRLQNDEARLKMLEDAYLEMKKMNEI